MQLVCQPWDSRQIFYNLLILFNIFFESGGQCRRWRGRSLMPDRKRQELADD
jgi:hypothetical protein